MVALSRTKNTPPSLSAIKISVASWRDMAPKYQLQKKRKSILILLLEGIIFDTELQAKKNYYWQNYWHINYYMHYVKFFSSTTYLHKKGFVFYFHEHKTKMRWDSITKLYTEIFFTLIIKKVSVIHKL